MGDERPRVLTEIQRDLWAMDPEILLTMYGALTVDMGAKLATADRVHIKGSVGFVDINGPIAGRKSFLTEFFGLNSVEQISADLRALEADDSVTDIVLLVDSPGGVVTGMSDLSQQVRALGKRTTAFVSGTMSSAAYWVGSATDTIVASETAIIGSIGVVATVTPFAKMGEITVVSSQTPLKNQDPSTKDGLASLQAKVDSLADIFINNVAANRGVDRETVLQSYGKGDTFLAAEALNRGMIDGISSLQDLVGSLTAANSGKQEGKEMDLKTLQKDFPEVFEAAVKIGVETERKRAEAHLVMAEASGDMKTAIEAIKTGSEMDSLCIAKYQAAGIRNSIMTARSSDNPEGINGELDTPSKTEKDVVLEAVIDGLSFYGEGSVD